MHYARFLPAAVVALAPLALPVSAQEATAIRYQWHKGETLRYHYTVHTAVKLSDTPIGTLEMKYDHDCTLRLTVEDVSPEGAGTLRGVYEAVRTESDQGIGGHSVFDSKQPDMKEGDKGIKPSAASASLAAVVNQPFTVVLDARGAVVSVDVKALETQMAEAGKAAPSGVVAAKTAFGEDAMRRMFRRAFEHLPPTPVKPGDTWTIESELMIPTVDTFTPRTLLTFKGTEGSGPAATAKISGELQELKVAGNKSTIKTEGSKGHEDLTFDVSAGVLRALRSDLTAPMEMSQGSGGKPAKVDVQSTFTLDRLEGQAGTPKDKPAENGKPADAKPKPAEPKPQPKPDEKK